MYLQVCAGPFGIALRVPEFTAAYRRVAGIARVIMVANHRASKGDPFWFLRGPLYLESRRYP
jgi:hypothetical protein